MNKNINTNYRWVILIINFLACAMSYAGLTIWSMASGELAVTFNISSIQASLGSGLFMGGYALASFVMAYLAPKIGFRLCGIISLGLMVVGTFIIPVAPSYGIILLARFMQGWGILWLVGVNSSIAWFPKRQIGLASGVVGGGLTLGIGIGGWVATALIGATGSWQSAFKTWAIILLVFTVIWAILFREPGKDMYPEDVTEEVEASMAKSVNPYKTVAGWLCIAVMFFDAWQLIGFNTVMPGFLQAKGYSAAQAATALLVAGLVGVVATPIGGIISDSLVKKGMEPLKSRAFTQGIPGFLVAAVSTFVFPALAPVSFGLAVVMSMACGWGVPVVNATSGALPVDLLKDPEAGGKLFGGTILIGLGLGGILVPSIAAAIAENAGWNAAFIILAAGALVGTIISVVLPKFKLSE